MKQIKETAYAKINLGLDILGKRDDGYHEVSMIMQSVGLSDEVVISKGNGIQISCNLHNLSCGPDNLAYRAAALLAGHCDIIPNVHIALNKKIFLAAGLAGGSSDAAAVLRGLNRYWELNLENYELEQLAAQLGSDIPFKPAPCWQQVAAKSSSSWRTCPKPGWYWPSPADWRFPPPGFTRTLTTAV